MVGNDELYNTLRCWLSDLFEIFFVISYFIFRKVSAQEQANQNLKVQLSGVEGNLRECMEQV